jgi:hypothetical protein
MTPLSTQGEVDGATTTLNGAITTFKNLRNEPTPVVFNGVTATVADGTSVSMELSFSPNIADLATGNITLSEGDTNRDNLKSGEVAQSEGIYSQALQGITATKTITVSVLKAGYVITPKNTAATQVTLSYAANVSFNLSTYPSTGATTAVDLQFGQAIANLSANDIYIEDEAGQPVSVIKGTAFDDSGTEGSTYRLPISGSVDTTVTVRPNKAGYHFNPESIEVNLDYAANAAFNSASTTELNGTTTSITLAFSKDIDGGLFGADITLETEGGEATKSIADNAALTKKSGSVGVYELPVNTTNAGDLRVTVAKSGTEFTISERVVTLQKASTANVSLSEVHDVSGTTKSITLYFTSGGSGDRKSTRLNSSH